MGVAVTSFRACVFVEVQQQKRTTIEDKKGKDKTTEGDGESEVEGVVGGSTRGTRLEPHTCLLYTSPSPRDGLLSRMPSSA